MRNLVIKGNKDDVIYIILWTYFENLHVRWNKISATILELAQKRKREKARKKRLPYFICQRSFVNRSSGMSFNGKVALFLVGFYEWKTWVLKEINCLMPYSNLVPITTKILSFMWCSIYWLFAFNKLIRF